MTGNSLMFVSYSNQHILMIQPLVKIINSMVTIVSKQRDKPLIDWYVV